MDKTHSDKIREALIDLGSARPNEIMDWIRRHYPDDTMNPKSYRSDIIGCSINHSSSRHYPNMPKILWFEEETKKYRLADSDKLTQHKTHDQIIAESEAINIDGVPVAKLSVTGQILIPSAIREKQGFHPRDILAFVVNEHGHVELRKAKLKIELE